VDSGQLEVDYRDARVEGWKESAFVDAGVVVRGADSFRLMLFGPSGWGKISSLGRVGCGL
jgi:hypothetical protein